MALPRFEGGLCVALRARASRRAKARRKGGAVDVQPHFRQSTGKGGSAFFSHWTPMAGKRGSLGLILGVFHRGMSRAEQCADDR
jgi:hypothetical protein